MASCKIAVREGFEVGDLKLVLSPKIHIDEFKSKMGRDDAICVVSFLVNDKQASLDLIDFIEKGYDFVLDADISASEISPGSYLVFIELQRRRRVIQQLSEMLEDLRAASGHELKDWVFRYMGDSTHYPITKEMLLSHVPLSPRAYREQIINPIKEMAERAGISIQEHVDKDAELLALQRAAGID